MDKEVNWGVIGTGFAAVEFGEGLRSVRGAKIGAVTSRSEARCKRYADRFGVPRVHLGYEAIFADTDVDAVYIASHNPLHARHCIAALNAGKAVLCEKPFAMTATEAAEVVHLARRRNLFCMEAMRTAFLPAVRRARRAVAAGEIGDISLLQATIGHHVPFDATSRFYDPGLGGGALMDIGCYPIALAVSILGKPDSISAQATFVPSGVDDSFAAVLSFPGGAVASISGSMRAAISPDPFIAGTRGTIHLHGAVYSSDRMTVRAIAPNNWPDPDVLDRYPPSGRMARIKADPAFQRIKPMLRAVLRERDAQYLPGAGNGFTDEIAEAVACLRDGKTESDIHPLDRTLIAMEIIDEIRNQCA
jgi:predicted dehydrogenase